MEQSNKCPKCGCTDIGKGKLSGYAAIIPVGKLFTAGSTIIAEICINCGYIIEMHVENPERFKHK